MTVHVVIPGLPVAAAASTGVLERLPVLRQLQAWRGAVQQPAPAWRRGLLRALLGAPAASLAPAAVAAAALPDVDAPASVWFAQPVHMMAGMTRGHMHPEGVLWLPPEQLQALADGFARALGGEGARLQVLGDGLLLWSDTLPEAAGGEDDPVLRSGEEVPAGTPNLPAPLRRLATEVEMWLPDCALNRQRLRQGALPVTALWLWGGVPAQVPSVPSPLSPWPAAGQDPLLQGLAALGACTPPVAASSWPAGVVGGRGVAIVALPQSAGRNDVEALEAQWLAPLLAALQARHLDEAWLWVAGACWHLRQPAWRRWWRRVARR